MLAAALTPSYLAKGCVNIIELSSFKAEAGARWPRLCESVYARLETMLRARLGPNDFFIRLGDIAYLVTMPSAEPEEINATCLRISFDLHTSFLGQCSVGQIEVSIVGAGVDDTLVSQKLSVEKVTSLAVKAGITFSPSAPDMPLEYSTDLRRIAASRDSPQGSVSTMQPPPQMPSALTVEHHFVPIWSVRNAAVTTYVCEPKTIFAAGRQDSIPISMLTPKERIQVDIDAFKTGVVRLAQAYSSGDKFLLAAAVSFELLGSPTGRMEFLAVCRNLSHSYRNYISFIICDVPPGVAQSRLASMVTILQPFGRGISATIAPTQRAFTSYQGIGLQSIGFNLREFSSQASLAQNDVEQLAQFARRANLGTFLYDVRDRLVLKYAQDANIAHLSGPAIALATSEPLSMWRLTWADTLSRPGVEIWD